jgi:hypothetical protein
MTTTRDRQPISETMLRKTGLWQCRFCFEGHHRSCPSAVRTPTGLILCHCPDCPHPTRCLECGHATPDELDLDYWACQDKAECNDRVRTRKADSPMVRMLQQCRSDAAIARRQSRQVVADVRAQTWDEDEVPTHIDPKPVSGLCGCCGQPTKGGRFLPGHDARLKSRLRDASRRGDPEATQQLVDRGWYRP